MAVKQERQDNFRPMQVICTTCGLPFMWSVSEQRYAANRGYTNPPKKCRVCRRLRAEELESIRNSNVNGGTTRTVIKNFPAMLAVNANLVICNECGGPSIVPAVPSFGTLFLCEGCRAKAEATKK